MSTYVKVDMHPFQKILKDHGIDKNGHVQLYVTGMINKRIRRYMPYLTGIMAEKLTFIKSPTEIKVDTPYVRYTYYGRVMKGKPPMVATNIPLSYTKTHHPDAGPFWDRALLAKEKSQMIQEVQNYIDSTG